MKAVVAILLSLGLALASVMRHGYSGFDAPAFEVACADACSDNALQPEGEACGGSPAAEDRPSGAICDCVSCPCCVAPTPRPSVPRPTSTPIGTSDWRTGLQWTPAPAAILPPMPERSWAVELVPSAGVRALGRRMSAPEQRCVWRT